MKQKKKSRDEAEVGSGPENTTRCPLRANVKEASRPFSTPLIISKIDRNPELFHKWQMAGPSHLSPEA
ncbi:MAG: hypothetical protein D6722_29675 [Bacteroidetes bacterium]|nr:MAG: hypothetical protein D6722_29675 [Bacteroidota bacterium]